MSNATPTTPPTPVAPDAADGAGEQPLLRAVTTTWSRRQVAAIKAVSLACDNERGAPVLNSLCLRVADDGWLRVAATDGRMVLIEQLSPAAVPPGVDLGNLMVWPRNLAAALRYLDVRSDDTVSVRLSSRAITLSLRQRSASIETLRLGDYPDVWSFMDRWPEPTRPVPDVYGIGARYVELVGKAFQTAYASRAQPSVGTTWVYRGNMHWYVRGLSGEHTMRAVIMPICLPGEVATGHAPPKPPAAPAPQAEPEPPPADAKAKKPAPKRKPKTKPAAKPKRKPRAA